MHVVTSLVDRSTLQEGKIQLVSLLELLDRTWETKHLDDRSRTDTITVPRSIVSIEISGEIYRFANPKRRVVWFDCEKSGRLCRDRFFISEVEDSQGHVYQLLLDRSRGGMPDDVVIARIRPLYCNRQYAVGRQPYLGDSRSS